MNDDVATSFRVMGFHRRHASNSREYIRLRLENFHEAVTGYAWQGSYRGPSTFNNFSPVTVCGERRSLDGKPIMDIRRINLIESISPDSIELIPSSACATNYEQLRELQRVVASIQQEPLRKFVHAVFWDMMIAIPFLKIPASRNHHHAEPGGLIKHSIECVRIVESFPLISGTSRDLAIVGALFHDVGKIKTLVQSGRHSQIRALVDHDCLTLEVLNEQLSTLDQTWPDAALALRHVWTSTSIRHWGASPKMAIAHLVQSADNMSMNVHMEKKLFGQVESWRSFSSSAPNQRSYWRPDMNRLPNDNYS